jgi:uncharacterized repeat protein (TIGR03803 family)
MSRRRLRVIAGMAAIMAAIGCALSTPAQAPVQYQYKILHSFAAHGDGSEPQGRVVFDQKGNLYGTTEAGGAYNGGTAFELTPNANGQWTETILHSFADGATDGAFPTGVVIDGAGDLYGTTTFGGTGSQCTSNEGCGTVFELSPGANGQWTESILYDFCSLPNCADGSEPKGSPSFDAKGNWYGQTASGGIDGLDCDSGCGTVFGLHPQSDGQWKEVELYDFQSANSVDGSGPGEGMTVHGQGIYGATGGGGTAHCSCGTVFEVMRGSGNTFDEQVLHSLANAGQGITPSGPVEFDSHGDLFGVTLFGGSPSCECGVVYGMRQGSGGNWGYAVLHAFAGTDGSTPNSGLTVDSKGNLYGVAAAGGPNGYGVVFELSPMKSSR